MTSSVKAFLRRIAAPLHEFGLDPFKFLAAIRLAPTFLVEWYRFKRLAAREGYDGRIVMSLRLHDRNAPAGIAGGHYFHQDLLVASRIYSAMPKRHVDVGSRIDGFVAHVAVFREITVLDIRPTTLQLGNIIFQQADLSSALPEPLLACCDSLSCLHALEHFGLGRYGDRIDVLGHQRGLDNLHAMLQEGGTLYLSVPIGISRIEFNEQRVFGLSGFIENLKDRFTISRFSYVDDSGALHENIPLDQGAIERNMDCHYGCGIFELVKAGATQP